MDPHTEVIAIHDHNISTMADIDSMPVPPVDPPRRYMSHVVPLIPTDDHSPILSQSDWNTALDIDGSQPCSTTQLCPANSIQLAPEPTVAQPLYVFSSYPSLCITLS